MPKPKAAIIITPSDNVCPARQAAVVPGVSILFAGFGMQFNGQHVSSHKDGQTKSGPIIGYLTPLEGDEEASTLEGFRMLLQTFHYCVSETPLAEWFADLAVALYDEDRLEEGDNPLAILMTQRAKSYAQVEEEQSREDDDDE